MLHESAIATPARRGRPLGAVILVCAASALLLLAGCGEEPEQQAAVIRPVKTITIAVGTAGGSLEYPGQISAAQEADLAFEVPGQLTDFPVNEGQAVRKGEILARLDASDFEARRDADTAKLNEARAEYQRYRDLYESNAVSLSDLEVKRRQFEVAEATLRTSEKAVQDTRLRAPFDGVVSGKRVENFQNVQAKQTILTLQDNSGLEIDVNFPENDWARVRPGLEVGSEAATFMPRVVVSTFPGRSFSASMKEVSTAADPTTRTFGATFSFPAPDDVNVLPGMTARLVLTAPEAGDSGRTTIPSGAVVSDEEGNAFVWKLDPATMTVGKAPVQVGEMSGADIELLGGLQSGDEIAVSGVMNLREGMQIKRFE